MYIYYVYVQTYTSSYLIYYLTKCNLSQNNLNSKNLVNSK